MLTRIGGFSSKRILPSPSLWSWSRRCKRRRRAFWHCSCRRRRWWWRQSDVTCRAINSTQGFSLSVISGKIITDKILQETAVVGWIIFSILKSLLQGRVCLGKALENQFNQVSAPRDVIVRSVRINDGQSPRWLVVVSKRQISSLKRSSAGNVHFVRAFIPCQDSSEDRV